MYLNNFPLEKCSKCFLYDYCNNDTNNHLKLNCELIWDSKNNNGTNTDNEDD